MGAIRWRDLLGPPSLFVSSALLITAIVPAAIAAGPPRPPPSPATPCPTAGPASEGDPAVVDSAGLEAEITAETLFTRQGEETGLRLSVDTAAAEPLQISLPPESFVAPPAGELLVYGAHTPAGGSEVRAVSLASGCDIRLARPSEVVRSALLDPSGRRLYVHAVTETERQDLGISRHDLASGEVRPVMEPLPKSERFGVTFATQLRWSLAGEELAVQSCGFEHCRTRVLDVASGEVETYAGEGHGALLGLDERYLYTFDTCHGAPCDLLAIERPSGDTSTLVEDVFGAHIETDERGTLLIIETAAGVKEVRP